MNETMEQIFADSVKSHTESYSEGFTQGKLYERDRIKHEFESLARRYEMNGSEKARIVRKCLLIVKE